GALLLVLGQTGTVNVFDPFIDGLEGNFLPPAAGWVLGFAVLVLYVGALFWRRSRRLAAGLAVDAPTEFAGRIVLVLAAVLVATAVLNADRGVPVAVLILLAFVVGFDFVT